MLDFLAKKTKSEDNEPDSAAASPANAPGSLLDLFVPFSDNFPQDASGQYQSLLEELDAVSRERDEFLAEYQAADRAEPEVRPENFENTERLKRFEAARSFDDKADILANEIERVRAEKIHALQTSQEPRDESAQAESDIPQQHVANPEYLEDHDGLYGQGPSKPPRNRPATQFDIEELIRSVIKSWKLVGIMAIIGAVMAGIYARSLPNEYLAWAELSISPRDLKIVDSQLSSSEFGGEAMFANLESQLRIIESSSVLNAVIAGEGLLNDPEFIGRSAGMFGFMDKLFPPSNASKSSKTQRLALEKLQDSLTIVRGNRTFIVSIGITTADPQKSARLANAVARAYVAGEIGARSQTARVASESLQNKLTNLRKNVLDAEQAIESYKAENGLISSEGKLTTEVQLSRLNEQLANAKIDTINAQTRMEQARATDLSDVISGILPISLNSGTISSLRIRYSGLKSSADRLATKLGRKHPELIAAQAELDSTRKQISQEIRRLINGTSKNFERAKNRQQSLNQQVMSLEARASGVGALQIELRDLERKLEAHDRVYKDYLLRSRETGEQEGITTTNTREITEATPPLEKIGPSRKIYVVIGLIIGGLLGLVLAALNNMFGFGRSRISTPQLPDEQSGHSQQAELANNAWQRPHDFASRYAPNMLRPGRYRAT